MDYGINRGTRNNDIQILGGGWICMQSIPCSREVPNAPPKNDVSHSCFCSCPLSYGWALSFDMYLSIMLPVSHATRPLILVVFSNSCSELDTLGVAKTQDPALLYQGELAPLNTAWGPG